MSGMLFPDIAGALSSGAQAGAASAQGRFLMEDRAAKNEIAPLIPKALQGDREALDKIGARHPDTLMKITPLLERADASTRAKAKETAEWTTKAAMGVLSLPEAERPAAYQAALADGQRLGYKIDMPPQYDRAVEGRLRMVVNQAQSVSDFLKGQDGGFDLVPPGGGGGAASGDVIGRTKQAIGGMESGNRYDAVGPDTGGGKRAYGKYQVMDFNIGPWTQEALGRALTPQQFLASPQAQEAVADFKLGQYIKQYGSPEAAARAWFAGAGGMNNPGAKDVLGTSVQGYGQKFAQAFGPGATGGAQPPGIAQGDAAPRGDASGNPIPTSDGGTVPREVMRMITPNLPPGANLGRDRKTGKFMVQEGNFVVYDDNKNPIGLYPIPKAPGADKGLFGDSLTGRALAALRSLSPDSQEYAAAYAILSKPQVVPDGAGGFTTIQPMNLSMFPKPTFAGGAFVEPPPAGGPAPTQVGGVTVQNIPGRGKPLDNSARDELTKASGGVLELTELVKSFDNSFGGFMSDMIGSADNLRKRNFPDVLGGKDEKGQAQWWQRYQQFANLERNKLFGAALTPGEAAEFNKAMINPGMKPEQITTNLARQRDIAAKALSRIVNSLVASGYNPQAIEAATGISVGDLPSPMGGVPQASPAPAAAPAPAPAPQQQPAPQTPQGADRGKLLFDARDAIAKGAPRDKVIERLRAMGIEDEP